MRTVLALCVLWFVAPAQAGDDWSVDWYSMDAGGGLHSTGGDWEVSGTIGQHDATPAHALVGDDWRVTGGFWALFTDFFDQIFADRFQAGGFDDD